MWFPSRCHDFSATARPTRRGQRAPLALVLAVCGLLVGCKIVLLSGPSTVAVGETATYVLALSYPDSFLVVTPFYVVAEVPAGWDLESIAWVGTAGSLPVASGGLVVESSACKFTLGDVRPAYQRLHVQPASFPAELTVTDTGEATLEFTVGSQPAGQFEVFFVFGSNTQCSVPEILTVNRQGPGFLTLLQELVDGVGGIAGLGRPREVTPSPDGQQLYVAAGVDGSVAVLARDEASGELTLSEVESDAFSGAGALAPPAGVRVSPDGEFVYVASLPDAGKPGGIATFSRHPTTGGLTFVDRVLDDVDNLAISPDGRHLYAAGAGEVSVYRRDEASGLLTYFESISPGGELAISPDGRHLYATDDSVTVYGRDETSGQLTFLGTGPSLSADMTAISPDGRHLYSVVGGSSSLVVQGRDEVTGALSSIATIDLIAGLPRFFDRGSVAVSPDGAEVVASGAAGMTVFRRHPVTGGLTLAENRFNGDLPIDGFSGQRALAFAPGGEHLYAASVNDDALLAFRTLPLVIFNDGFESGSTSAWSASVP